MTAERRTAGRRGVEIGNAGKVLFDDVGVTKRDLADYYREVAPALLPHIREHPLAVQRFPDGVGAEGFIQKKVPESAPDWLGRVSVPREQGGEVTMPVVGDAAGLLFLADQAAVTLHPLLSRSDRLRCPDRLIFDLDPPDGEFGTVRDGASALRDLLEQLRLPSYVMTTGSRGLHVTVPLDRSADFDEVRALGRGVADVLASRHPDALTTEVRKEKRRGRVFVDILRNAYAQHAVAPYSVRPLPGAPVATPLRWDEVDGDLTPQRWRLRDVPERLAADGDPWRGMSRHAHSTRAAADRLARLAG
ncbi:MAG: non-homologous end-joining DNA ligase [Streptosporangiales bacterium]|nr:non-homologous end-joining DNA ligase [Streptosporangiales bacterium]MBO0891476.1 non-homologous end-joining DNA ligase [Acidothermales bacterium]